MLHDLAVQDSSSALARRLRRYTSPTILGELEYDLYRKIKDRYPLRWLLTSSVVALGLRRSEGEPTSIRRPAVTSVSELLSVGN